MMSTMLLLDLTEAIIFRLRNGNNRFMLFVMLYRFVCTDLADSLY